MRKTRVSRDYRGFSRSKSVDSRDYRPLRLGRT
jgi:hypothetical protein